MMTLARSEPSGRKIQLTVPLQCSWRDVKKDIFALSRPSDSVVRTVSSPVWPDWQNINSAGTGTGHISWSAEQDLFDKKKMAKWKARGKTADRVCHFLSLPRDGRLHFAPPSLQEEGECLQSKIHRVETLLYRLICGNKDFFVSASVSGWFSWNSSSSLWDEIDPIFAPLNSTVKQTIHPRCGGVTLVKDSAFLRLYFS